ncbi:unnamed protein product [Acanthosepion pharaonis]|uniref:Uncharacterized protein n=1 Tax=Acanthosepion pharaonis TaxID=158019 RepID=A0A812CYP4_ACAPH|nr:unnamed protein product [Sepia pharaonis]
MVAVTIRDENYDIVFFFYLPPNSPFSPSVCFTLSFLISFLTLFYAYFIENSLSLSLNSLSLSYTFSLHCLFHSLLTCVFFEYVFLLFLSILPTYTFFQSFFTFNLSTFHLCLFHSHFDLFFSFLLWSASFHSLIFFLKFFYSLSLIFLLYIYLPISFFHSSLTHFISHFGLFSLSLSYVYSVCLSLCHFSLATFFILIVHFLSLISPSFFSLIFLYSFMYSNLSHLFLAHFLSCYGPLFLTSPLFGSCISLFFSFSTLLVLISISFSSASPTLSFSSCLSIFISVQHLLFSIFLLVAFHLITFFNSPISLFFSLSPSASLLHPWSLTNSQYLLMASYTFTKFFSQKSRYQRLTSYSFFFFFFTTIFEISCMGLGVKQSVSILPTSHHLSTLVSFLFLIWALLPGVILFLPILLTLLYDSIHILVFIH